MYDGNIIRVRQIRISFLAHCATLLNLGGTQTNRLKFYIKSLAAAGAAVPMRQMLPLTPGTLNKLWKSLPRSEGLTVVLCWKAASRWTETVALTRDRFCKVRPERIVIW